MATLPGAAHAESKFVTGTGSLLATANLDFTITIPKFVYLRVGTGPDLADSTTVNNLVYSVPAASIGNGTAVAGTGGDLGDGTVTARVMGNNGTISFSSTALGAMNNGAGDQLSWTQIDVAVATNTSATALPHPAMNDSSTGIAAPLPITSGSKVTSLDAKWTFTYKNQNVVAAGTYGGVNANNGRRYYTASMP